MFYNGNVKIEPGAVVCRVAPSFVRFGTFQLPVSRGGMQVRYWHMMWLIVILSVSSSMVDIGCSSCGLGRFFLLCAG
jgi:hypothetical protein